jgi:hypothetical protein
MYKSAGYDLLSGLDAQENRARCKLPQRRRLRSPSETRPVPAPVAFHLRDCRRHSALAQETIPAWEATGALSWSSLMKENSS